VRSSDEASPPWAARFGDGLEAFGEAVEGGDGLGVQQDYAEAAKWTRKAAEQGYSPRRMSAVTAASSSSVRSIVGMASGLVQSAVAGGTSSVGPIDERYADQDHQGR
jgi:TPR repeat protein